jgi:hypothetical protein
VNDRHRRSWWPRLVDQVLRRVRVWSEAPDPSDREMVAMAAAAFWVLAIANLKAGVRRLFANSPPLETATTARGVVICGPDTEALPMCLLAGRRRWWRTTSRGTLLASLHVERRDGGIIVVLPGVVYLAGRLRRQSEGIGDGHDGLSEANTFGAVGGAAPKLMVQFAIGDRVEVTAGFEARHPTGSPYRGRPASVARGLCEIRIVG